MSILERATATLTDNVEKTIRSAKREGIVSMSLDCLKQCTPTSGLQCPPAMYHNIFEDVARSVAKRLRFPITR